MDRSLEFYVLSIAVLLPILAFFIFFFTRWIFRRSEIEYTGTGVDVSKLGYVDLLGSLLFVGIFSLALTSIPEVGQKAREISLANLLNVAVFHGLMATMVLCILVWRVSVIEFFGLSKASVAKIFGGVFIGYMAMLLVGISLSLFNYNAFIEQIFGKLEMQESVNLLRESDDMAVVWVMTLLACVIAPIAEEIVFRGYLYPVMKRFSGRVFAMISSSLFFAAIHVNVLSLLPLFILAILLVLLYEHYESLWVPIGLHMLFNTSTVVAQLVMKDNPQLLTP